MNTDRRTHPAPRDLPSTPPVLEAILIAALFGALLVLSSQPVCA